MTTILIPHISTESKKFNLLPAETAGHIESSSSAQSNFGPATLEEHSFSRSKASLAVGDRVSASIEAKVNTGGDEVRLVIIFRDSIGTTITQIQSASDTSSTSYTFLTLEDVTIPADTVFIGLAVLRFSGSGSWDARKGMVNRGSSVSPYSHPHTGPSFTGQTFGLERGDQAQETFTGAQVSIISRINLWQSGWTMPSLKDRDLRLWRSFLTSMSSFENRFLMTPPEYTGPSTGYEGPQPLVNGAGQLGRQLNVDNADASVDLLNEGDYFSVLADGQWELKMVTEDVVTDGGGTATINFTPSFRNSPGDGDTVFIYAPRAQFRFVSASSSWSLDQLLFGSVRVQCVEVYDPS